MLTNFKSILALIFLITFIVNGKAQGRLKVGGGINYIANDFRNKDNLNNYFAPSVNVNYNFFKLPRFGLSIESATTFKSNSKDLQDENTFAFTTSLPLIASINTNKNSFYVGSGPAYIKHTERNRTYDERVSDYFLGSLAGVSFKGKPILGDLIFFEYNVRLSYFKSLKSQVGDAAALSFIIFLRA